MKKFVSILMALCILTGVAVPAYAMEISTSEEMNTCSTTTSDPLNLVYGQSKTLAMGETINQKTYTYLGTLKLPDDPRIHRIIFKASFGKYNDTGIGDVKLDVRFKRDGTPIYDKSFAYLDYNGVTGQQIVNGVSMGQEIEVWVDASSVSQSNGNIRSIFLYAFEVYTD